MISHFDAVAANSARVLAAAAHMGMPIAATEQYPKYLSLFLFLSLSLWPKSLWSSLPFFRGLGPTVPELELEKFGVKVQIPPRNVVISYKGKDYKSVLATQHRD